MATSSELFVCSTTGDDEADGLTRETALQSIQTAVDRSGPGTEITLLTGWHEGGIELSPGTKDQPIVLRGERLGRVFIGTPGNVVTGWESVPELEYTYVTAMEVEPRILMEATTGNVMRPMPSIMDVEYLAGTFHFDAEAGQIYLHPGDSESARRHIYRSTIPGGIGIELADYTVLENLTITGMGLAAILGADVNGVVVRRCQAVGNGWAIRLRGAVDCLIEDNHFWQNVPTLRSQVYIGGSPTGEPVRGVVVQNNMVHDSSMASIRFYSTGPLEACVMRGNILTSSHSKGVGTESGLLAENNVAQGAFWAFEGGHNTYMDSPRSDFIKETDLVLIREGRLGFEAFGGEVPPLDNAYWRLADPKHLDFRLQSDSPARGAAPDGSDLGAHQYDGTVFFVSPEGDDQADGTSEASAWRTIGHATQSLGAGQTLYVAPGAWDETLELKDLVSDAVNPARVRAQGRGMASFRGLKVENCENLEMWGVYVQSPVGQAVVSDSRGVSLLHCAVIREGTTETEEGAWLVTDSSSITIGHGAVSSAGPGLVVRDSSDIELVSSVLASVNGPQVELQGETPDFWSEFNAFVELETDQVIGRTSSGHAQTLDEWRSLTGFDKESAMVAASDFVEPGEGDFAVVAGTLASYLGRYGAPVGPRETALPETQRAPFERIQVVSATRESVNLSWWTPGRITGTIVEWGETMDYGEIYDRSEFERGEYETFHTASLLGLKPGTEYHFRVGFRDHAAVEEGEEPPLIWSEDHLFVTAVDDPKPRDLFVSPEGNDDHDGLSRDTAWRTLAKAGAEARAGDTVTLLPGQYRELLRPLQTGTAPDRRITFRADQPLTVFLNGGFERDGTGRSHCAQIMGKAFITLENLVFEEAARDDNWGYRGFPGHAGLVRISGSTGIEIKGCVMDGRRRYMIGVMAEDLGAVPGVDSDQPALTVTDSLFLRNWYAFFVSGVGEVIMDHNAFIRSMVLKAALRAPTRLRNNIYQSLIRNKQGNRLFEGVEYMDSDYNCFAWDDDNGVRNVAWIDRETRTFASGLAEFQEQFGLDENSIEAEPGYGLSEIFGFLEGSTRRGLTLDAVILPEESPCRGAGENGADIGPRWEKFLKDPS